METKENNKYKPFNLEEAKAGKPICTRVGHKARIICFDAKTLCDYPIIALVENAGNSIYEAVCSFSNEGEYRKGNIHDLDLVMPIERLTLSFQELVKTYEDACEITGSVPDIECDDRSELARLKLIQIYKASNILNDNWKLTPLGTQCAFYPSFMWEKDRLVCDDICHTLYSVSYDPKLCCGKREDAFYIGTRFIDLYRDYLLLE